MEGGQEIGAGGRVARRTAPAVLAFLLAAIMTATLISAADSSMELTPPQEPIPASYFDLNILFHPATHVPWPSVPFYGWRLSHANWTDLEPEKGKWYFDLLDKYVAMAQEHNTEILMTLTYTPPWASSRPDAPSDFPNLNGLAGPPRDMNDWTTFVRTVATRYKGKIHVYEIWNEPDRDKDWVGTVDQLVGMVREASRVLKEVDPTITVLSPCPETPRGPQWIGEFLRKGGGQYVDAVAYHFYVGGNPPEAMVPVIQSVRKVMTENGAGNKPLWNTEAGWHDPRPFPSQDMAAAWVARAYILNWAAGVSRFYFYCWDNHNWTSLELTEPDNTTLRPGGLAFEAIQKWLTGSVMRHVWTSDNKNWVVQIDQGGRAEYIVWNEQGDRSFRLSKDWHVSRVTQLLGGTSAIQGDSVQIGIQPVLIQ
jgi:hypothetical protein